MHINPEVEIVLDPAVAPAGAVLARTASKTLIVLDPALSEAERQALIEELTGG